MMKKKTILLDRMDFAVAMMFTGIATLCGNALWFAILQGIKQTNNCVHALCGAISIMLTAKGIQLAIRHDKKEFWERIQ